MRLSGLFLLSSNSREAGERDRSGEGRRRREGGREGGREVGREGWRDGGRKETEGGRDKSGEEEGEMINYLLALVYSPAVEIEVEGESK